MKNLGDTILFSLAVVFFIIGVHQTMTWGLASSYFIFMLSLGMLFLYRYRVARRKAEANEAKNSAKKIKRNKR